ncbi:unnamed protein product [Trichobilharzia regenti]|nr:unnamed protein product [Trichobilharzia regenti]
MELIERRNQSIGFGENNINALWQAVEISQMLKNLFSFLYKDGSNLYNTIH